MNDDDCWKCNTCVGGRIFEDHVYCVDCYEDEIHEVAFKRLEEINRLMPILAAKDAEIVRLRKVLSFITTYGDSEHFSAAGFAGFALKEQGK